MAIRRVLMVLASIALFAACGGHNSPSSVPHPRTTAESSVGATVPGTGSTSGQGFISDFYEYAIESMEWTGTSAQTVWDGTGSPGDDDPAVDSLIGPNGERAFAFGQVTKASLEEFVAAFRKATEKVHPCPTRLDARSRRATIGGERAVLDETTCPAPGGVFVLTALTVHSGRVYVFVTFDQPGDEANMRDWFNALLDQVSFISS